MNKNLLISAGEPSGDLHGSNLTKALKELDPQLQIWGIGGRLMMKAGAQIHYPVADFAVLGFVEILRQLGKLKGVFRSLLKSVDRDRPDLAILIDYPGFNLRFARELKKKAIPIIYYISPQVWAWAPKRIEIIKRLVDKMIVIFKFEEDLYKKSGIDATFVGHPLIEVVKPSMSKLEALKAFNLSPHKKTVALLPGSREIELSKLLPIMLKAARIIQKELSQVQFILSKSPTFQDETFQEKLKGFEIPISLANDRIYDVINTCDLALVASGTATLETAILQKPMLIIYKLSTLSYLLLRPIIKIPYIGLVNVVAGRKIVPEYVQFGAQPDRIAQEAIAILQSNQRMGSIRTELSKVREKLGQPGASLSAARLILNFLEKRTPVSYPGSESLKPDSYPGSETG